MIPPHSRRNFSEIYKKMPMSELQAKLPTFDFQAYLTPLLPRKLNDSEEVVIYALSYYQKLVTLLDSTPSRFVNCVEMFFFPISDSQPLFLFSEPFFQTPHNRS